MIKEILKRTFLFAGIIISAVFFVSFLSVGMKPEILLVFEIFVLSFFVNVIQYFVKQVICTNFLANIMIEYFSVSVFVFLYGYFVEWFYRSNWWMAFVYVAVVYVPVYFLDMAVVKRDIDFINLQLERRREKDDKT
ncbi:MAG: hypothetical protein K2N72_11795 [Oscillospiraceae bacterium]|nr:hypothetical protein [Oscillospiraceae bacterium]